MTITIELTPEKEEALREKAAQQGKDAAAYVAALVEQDIEGQEGEQDAPKTLADYLAGHIGVFNSGGKERLSQNGGELFTDYLVEKHKAGHL